MAVRSDSKSGVPGVTWNARRGQWMARIVQGGRDIRVGFFDDLDEAKRARAETLAAIMPELKVEAQRRADALRAAPMVEGTPPIPLAWLKERLQRDKNSPTGFVWPKRPRSDFRRESDFKAWHSLNLRKPAGTVRERNGNHEGHVMLNHQGEKVFLDLRALVIAYDTGKWPGGKLPPWSDFHFVPPRCDERLRSGTG